MSSVAEGSAVLVLLLVSAFVLWQQLRSAPRSKSVAIVVLGDIGRSPRMLYHSQSFCNNGYTTYIVAYPGSNPPLSLVNSPNVRFVYLPVPLAFVSGLPRALFLVLAPLKVLLATVYLFYALLCRLDEAPSFILVQNPPAIPTLPIVKLSAFLLKSKVVIDWHNTGYSILSLRLGSHHPVVKFARWIETFWGQKAFAHLCVTEAMRNNLERDVSLKGKLVTFHDRPPGHFRRQTPEERSELFSRLPFLSDPAVAAFVPRATSSTAPDNSPSPILLVSATSWTADEDFSILLRALDEYEKTARSSTTLPKVIVVITGKGGGKEEFEKQVALLEAGESGWKWVRVRTAWLAIEDYPKLLGSADLGISLHTSSSGADLPMKVVDMFGCGLPALALDFACIGELVIDNVNGQVFKDASDLVNKLVVLLTDSGRGPSELARLAAGIRSTTYGSNKDLWGSWEESWDRIVRPTLESNT